MTALTISQIYNRYSVREFCRVIEIKRRNEDNSYESQWQNVEILSGLPLLEKSVNTISYKASNNSFNFGIVTVGNVAITLNSKNGQFGDENNSGSVFNGFIRHKSIVRIRDGYVDNYTDPNFPVKVFKTVFEGFIDGTSDNTKVDDENFLQTLQCVELMSFLLKEYRVADMGVLTSTTINTLVYEILNRPVFTNFFTVNSLNISAGYNISSFDITQYEAQTTLLTLFENFSIGHSFFYIRDGIFYYSAINSGNVSSFEINAKKLIKFSAYSPGISNVIELFNWEEQPDITFVASPNKYNKSQTINIKGCTDTAQRQNVLNTIGNLAKIQRKEFKISIPYFMDVFVMDEIVVQSPQIYPSDAFIWGVSKWGEKVWRRSLKADSIDDSATWLVREVKHSNFKTEIILQET